MPPKVLAITGPTATGKTRLGVELALRHNGEIVSVDSMQIYRRMDIGTAKPTMEERRGVPHHMIDVAEPWESYSVSRFVSEASACVDDILRRGKLPILVGGTGLYLDSLLSGRTFAPSPGETEIRQRLWSRVEQEGMPALFRELQSVDPDSAKRLHPNDAKRVLRALEVYHLSGETISEHNEATRSLENRYDALVLALSFEDRDHLKARIDRRVDEMVRNGLWEEASRLLAENLPSDCTAYKAIGYKELFPALLGQASREDAVAELKLRSRQYAKRQLTWLRRKSNIHWILWGAEPDFVKAIQVSTKCMEEFDLL